MQLRSAIVALGCSALAACGDASAASTAQLQAAAARNVDRPNIIFILSDDEDVALHSQWMPKTKALLHQRGTTFDNAFVSYALCCPSRATALRGQYAHSTAILGNRPPSGGYEKFKSLGRESSTIATWLKDAGYRTAMFGKYMNGYQPAMGVPAGWSEWYTTGAGYNGYNYTMNENGTLVQRGRAPEDFMVDVLAHKAADVIRRSAADKTPVFMYIAPFTPHGPSTPAPRHVDLVMDAKLPRTPAFNERDVSDKPTMVRDRPPLTPRVIARLEEQYRKRARSLQSVDDLVDSVVTALRSTGQLENSYIIYTSDNGFHLGEHRLVTGKNTAYEHDIRVPLVVRGPGVPAGRRVSQMVLNTDFAPTFAEMAGVRPPSFVEGRSFVPLFAASPARWSREAFLIERRGDRDAQLEAGDSPEVGGGSGFNSIRTAEYTYVEYANGERELYELKKDPDQLENLAARADKALVQRLSAWLAALVKCSGAECRVAEDAAPR